MNELEEKNVNDLEEQKSKTIVNESVVNQTVQTIDTESLKESVPKGKKNIKKYWYVILIVLMILGVGGYFLFKQLNKGNTSKNDNGEKEEITYKDSEYYSSFSLSDYQKIDGEYSYKEVYKPNDIVSFDFGYEMYSGYGIKELSFKLNYGPGLKLIKEIDGNVDCFEFSNNNGTNKMIIENECLETYGEYCEIVKSYQFKILDGYTSSDLYVEITDIKFKTVGNQYFKYPNIQKTLTLKSNKYYIYEENDEYGNYIRVSDVELYEEELNQVGNYQCDSNDCEYIGSSGDYILFDDFDLVAYNYKTQKVQEIKFDEDIDRVNQLVADAKIHGLIVEKDSKDGYYSIESNKYIIPLSEKNDLYYDSVGFIENRGDVWEIIDPQGNEFKPDISKLTKIDGTNFYYYTFFCGIEDCWYKFYNQKGVEISSEGEYWEYTITDDKNLLLIDSKDDTKNVFTIFDSEGNNIYTSKTYNAVYMLNADNYLAIIDTDNYLKLINSDEEVIATFTEMTKDKQFHYMISGSYEYNGKDGIYLVVQDPGVTVEEVLENNKDFTEHDIDWIKENAGYEYYYIPKTGETGKIPTAIGGYAKPVLYLYPENDNTNVTIKFEKPGLLTTTYPKFDRSWNVTANKNGDLYDNDGKYYYGLYWEELGSTKVDFSEGFYVTKDNAIEFLEEKLSIIGLNDRERNEFIMYWLPILEKNEKNLVYFELTEERDKFNKLNITPKPDSLLRMAIHVKKVNKKTNIKEQKLETFKRNGFVAVEWGGVIH